MPDEGISETDEDRHARVIELLRDLTEHENHIDALEEAVLELAVTDGEQTVIEQLARLRQLHAKIDQMRQECADLIGKGV